MARRHFGKIGAALAFGLVAASASASAQDGSVRSEGGTIPFSSHASPEARAAFVARQAEHGVDQAHDPIDKVRAYYEARDRATLARMAARYRVDVRRETMGGVEVQVVTPRGGVAAANRRRVLVNVHGGSFLFGWPSGALVESVPIAATGGFTVVTVNYRMAPEHTFPAGSEDVTAVYRALLKTYPPRGIGIYGCSAGGVLTGEAVAWIDHAGLPMPGAIGTFCGSIEGTGGDSQYTGSMLNGYPLPTVVKPMTQSGNGYLEGQSDADPLVIPARSPDLLRRFPPTLLITSTRDFALSNTITAHRDLVKAGVDADLHVWDGLWHAFFTDPDLPESRDAYDVIAHFFAARLAP